MFIMIFTMIIVFLIFRALCGAVGSGVKYVDRTVRIDKFGVKMIELLDSVDLTIDGRMDFDKVYCKFLDGEECKQLILTKDMKIHLLDTTGALEDADKMKILTIDNLNDILSLKVVNDNTLLIITEKISITFEKVKDIAELERFQLLINKYMNKENEGNN